MQIVRDEVGLCLVEAGQIRDRAGEGVMRFPGREIADVLTDENIAIDTERDAVFQMRADGENGFLRAVERDRERGVTAGAAQNHFPAGHQRARSNHRRA